MSEEQYYQNMAKSYEEEQENITCEEYLIESEVSFYENT